jgi:flagellar assembly protein FliH
MPDTVRVQLGGALTAVRVADAGGVPGPAQPADTAAAGGLEAAPGDPARMQQVQAERDRLASALAAVQEAGGQLAMLRGKTLKDAEAQIVELAINIARKVLMQEIAAGRYEIEPIVRAALAGAGGRQDVVVRLNGDDLAQCRLAGAEEGQAGPVRFVADPSIRRAECLVETPDGVIESSIEQHLDGVAEALKGMA